MIVLIPILLLVWLILANSYNCEDADVEFVLYSKADKRVVLGVANDQLYMPSGFIQNRLSIGIGFVWMNLNFYKLPKK